MIFNINILLCNNSNLVQFISDERRDEAPEVGLQVHSTVGTRDSSESSQSSQSSQSSESSCQLVRRETRETRDYRRDSLRDRETETPA